MSLRDFYARFLPDQPQSNVIPITPEVGHQRRLNRILAEEGETWDSVRSLFAQMKAAGLNVKFDRTGELMFTPKRIFWRLDYERIMRMKTVLAEILREEQKL